LSMSNTGTGCQRLIDRFGRFPQEIPEPAWRVYLGKDKGRLFYAYYNKHPKAPRVVDNGVHMATAAMTYAVNKLLDGRLSGSEPSLRCPKPPSS